MTAASSLRSIMHTSIVLTELRHVQTQLRIVLALLLSTMFFALVDPGIYILTLPNSLYGKIGLALQHPVVLAGSFFLIACSLIPFFVVQIFFPQSKGRRASAKLAVFGLFAAGLQWIFLSWFIWNWDVPSLAAVFIRLGIGAIAFSVALALSLNHELMRQYTELVP